MYVCLRQTEPERQTNIYIKYIGCKDLNRNPSLNRIWYHVIPPNKLNKLGGRTRIEISS